MPLGDSDPGIDKQKIIREIQNPPPETIASTAGEVGSKATRRFAGLRKIGIHLDDLALLLTLVVAFVWILAGLLLGMPVPLMIGGVLLVPAAYGLLQSFRRAREG